MEAVRTPRIQEVEETIWETAKRMLGFLGSSAAGDIDVAFGFADPANPFSSLRLQYREGGLEIPAEELGLGVQSALVVGVFEAVRRLEEPVGTVVIKEPEMYLHPQAQRYFHRLLTEMADTGECQVIYSTHSPIFADVERFEALRLVRKEPATMSAVSWVSDNDDGAFLRDHRDRLKVATAFDPARSELLFARRVLLVEGVGDRIAAQLTAEKMGVDLDAEGLSIVPCGSKTFIPFYGRVCRALGIPFCIPHDEDVLPEEGEEDVVNRIRERNAKEREANQAILDAAGDPSHVFVIAPSLEHVLGIGADARDKPRRVAEALEGRRSRRLPFPAERSGRGAGAGGQATSGAPVSLAQPIRSLTRQEVC
jgi:putative ATP-dependent endonuclease of OLD family